MKLWPHGGKNKIPNQLTQGSYLLPGALFTAGKQHPTTLGIAFRRRRSTAQSRL